MNLRPLITAWLVAILCVAASARSALAVVPLVLPAGESAKDWRDALVLSGATDLEPGLPLGAGPSVVFQATAVPGTWRLQVRDRVGGEHVVKVQAPSTDGEREELVALATSLLHPLETDDFWDDLLAAAPEELEPPPEPEEPPVVAVRTPPPVPPEDRSPKPEPGVIREKAPKDGDPGDGPPAPLAPDETPSNEEAAGNSAEEGSQPDGEGDGRGGVEMMAEVEEAEVEEAEVEEAERGDAEADEDGAADALEQGEAELAGGGGGDRVALDGGTADPEAWVRLDGGMNFRGGASHAYGGGAQGGFRISPHLRLGTGFYASSTHDLGELLGHDRGLVGFQERDFFGTMVISPASREGGFSWMATLRGGVSARQMRQESGGGSRWLTGFMEVEGGLSRPIGWDLLLVPHVRLQTDTRRQTLEPDGTTASQPAAGSHLPMLSLGVGLALVLERSSRGSSTHPGSVTAEWVDRSTALEAPWE